MSAHAASHKVSTLQPDDRCRMEREIKKLKEMLSIHLDLIQHQAEQATSRETQVKALRRENDMLLQKVERMERRLSVPVRSPAVAMPTAVAAPTCVDSGTSPPPTARRSSRCTQTSGERAIPPASQPAVQPAVQQAGQAAVQPAGQPAVQPAVQLAVQLAVQPIGQAAVQPEGQPAGQRAVQPAGQPTVQPTVQPAVQSGVALENRPMVQPKAEPVVQAPAQPAVQPIVRLEVQPEIHPGGQLTSQPEVKPAAPQATPFAAPRLSLSAASRASRPASSRLSRSATLQASPPVSPPASVPASSPGPASASMPPGPVAVGRRRGSARGRGRYRSLSTRHEPADLAPSPDTLRQHRKLYRKGDEVVRHRKCMLTDTEYYQYIPEEPEDWEGEECPAPSSQTHIEIPSWSMCPLNPIDSVVGVENLDDSTFAKRHAKLEVEEKRRKRWDLQRLREQRAYEKLKQSSVRGRGAGRPGGEEARAERPLTMRPPASGAVYLQVSPLLPVGAFGSNLPVLVNREFQLPWTPGKAPPAGAGRGGCRGRR